MLWRALFFAALFTTIIVWGIQRLDKGDLTRHHAPSAKERKLLDKLPIF